MKKTIATLCLVGSTLALGACDTTGEGHVDTAPPYSRTAVYEQDAEVAMPTPVAPAERVFQRAQTK